MVYDCSITSQVQEGKGRLSSDPHAATFLSVSTKLKAHFMHH